MVDLGKKDGRDSIFFIGIKPSQKKNWGMCDQVQKSGIIQKGLDNLNREKSI